MFDHAVNIFIGVQRMKMSIRMLLLKDPEYLICKRLAYDIYTLEVQNDLSELLEPGYKPFGLRPGHQRFALVL